MPDLEQDPSKRRLFSGVNILGHPTEIGLPGAREVGDVGLDLSSFAAQPTGPGAGGSGGVGAAPIGARPGEQMSGAGATAMQALGIGTRGLNLLARGVRSFSGGAEPTAGMPQAAIEAGITPEQFSHLTEAFGPMTPWEIQNLTAQDFRNVLGAAQEFGIPLTDAEVARIAEGAVGATSAEEAGALGTGGSGGAGAFGDIATGAAGPAIAALLNSIAGEPASTAFLSQLGAIAAAGAGSPIGAIAIPLVSSLMNAFGLDRPSPYQMTREGDALRMSARLPLAAYGIMSARSPEELTRVLQEQEFTRKDQNTNWSEADLINTLRNDPMALNVLTGNYHLDEAGIDQQINQLTKLAALKMQGGDTVNIPGWDEARAMLEKQVFSSGAVMMPWAMPGWGMPPTAGGDPWANYSALAQGPTTWFGDPYQSV